MYSRMQAVLLHAIANRIAGDPKPSGRARDVVFIAHELTPFSRRHLIRGTIDAIINQDPGHEARSATRLLIAERENTPYDAGQERIRIDIFIRDNVP